MIIFLYGPDTFRSQQKLKEIVDYYKKIHQSGLNLYCFEGGNLNFEDFKNEVETRSMFREKKLIVLKDIFSNKNFKEEFLKEKARFVNSDNIILIYEKREIEEKDPFFKFLKENSKFQEFKLLEGEKLKNWVKKELKNYGQEIGLSALELLINYVGNNLWQMENEIKKLVNYKNGKEIKKEDVELLVKPKIETDIFETIDAIAEKNRKKALILIKKHLEKGDSPTYLLAMINFQFRNLLIMKSHELKRKLYPNYMRIPKILGMHPYLIRKTIQQAKKFSFEELKKIYQKIFEADLNIKTGKLEPETALDLLISQI